MAKEDVGTYLKFLGLRFRSARLDSEKNSTTITDNPIAFKTVKYNLTVTAKCSVPCTLQSQIGVSYK